nr:pyruvate, phosphate dikinase/phosphoenolpyruvate synthase regulator [Desulfobulbaceae bacterium]
MKSKKNIYFVSGCTGIVAMDVGKSLLGQFPETIFHEEKFPFIKNISDALKTLNYILRQSSGSKPIVFSSLVNPEIREVFNHSEVELFDICDAFLDRLENCLHEKALLLPGFSRFIDDNGISNRAKAIDYCLEHDDGKRTDDYDKADVIVLGVSRSGKTPLSIYLATHMKLKAANYPLTEETLNSYRLPEGISKNIKKTVGLTTNPEILSQIRQERYPNSNYAKRSECLQELRQAEQIYQKYHIPYINTSRKSIEGLAAQIYQEIGPYKKTSLLNETNPLIERRIYDRYIIKDVYLMVQGDYIGQLVDISERGLAFLPITSCPLKDRWNVVLVNKIKNISTTELSLKVIRPDNQHTSKSFDTSPKPIAAIFDFPSSKEQGLVKEFIRQSC